MSTAQSISQWPGHYRAFAPRVRHSVRQYRAFVGRTWPNRLDMLEQQERRWVDPYGPIPYYIPFWLRAGFLGVDDQALDAIATANVFLYHYYTLKDDVLDGKDGATSIDMVAADALLAEALRRFAAAGVATESFYNDLRQYIVDTLKAEAYLQRRDGPPTLSDGPCIQMMGQKAALAKLSASALASVASDRPRLRLAEVGLDEMAVGVQMLDDLQDWREDAKIGRFTLVLGLAQDRVDKPLRTSDLSAVVYTNAVCGEILRAMEGHFEKAAQRFQRLGAVEAVSFLDSMVVNSKAVREFIERPRVTWRDVEKELRIRMQGGS